jgi:2-phospho-L-lactate guanylyltransferase (CobY/MobA/RfbA family)
LSAARATGHEVVVLEGLTGIAVDVDRPEDLARIRWLRLAALHSL